MTRLIIAEKPDMGRKIAGAMAKPHKAYQGYIETGEGVVTWCIGHIMESYEPQDYDPKYAKWNIEELPILPIEWKIKVNAKKQAQFKIIKELLLKSSEVVNAGDPGREGQLIVDEVLYFLKNKKPVTRALLYSLDPQYIKKAFCNLVDNKQFYNLYLAAVLRGYSDFVMGINGTRVYTIKAQQQGFKGVLSVGRVQTPTLAIITKRDEDIDQFIPHNYYTIIGVFEHQANLIQAYWKPTENTPKNCLDNEERLIEEVFATSITNKIKNKPGTVDLYEEKQLTELQPLPFNLSKMQIYANSKWGMSAREVLDTCQSLYQEHELQTYPRTDCQYLPENQFHNSSEILSNISDSLPTLHRFSKNANPSIKSHAWNDSKLGEHFGLIPTTKRADLAKLNDKEQKIYLAVCQRFIAQFFPVCEYMSASLSITCEGENFKATGKTILKTGWKEIYAKENTSPLEADDNEDEEQIFPNIKENDILLCKEGSKTNKKTKPPKRFTEGLLIEAMTNVHTLVSDPIQKKKLKEKKGIGQEATRTQIIEDLFRRGFLIHHGTQIISTENAKNFIKLLPKKVTDPGLTAIWEDALDKISQGQLSPETFKEKQNLWVTNLVTEAINTDMSGFNNNGKQQITKTTNSGRKSSEKDTSINKQSPHYSNNTKHTNNTNNKKTATNNSNKPCPKCDSGHMVERVARASGKKFLGCSNYPKCAHSEWNN